MPYLKDLAWFQQSPSSVFDQVLAPEPAYPYRASSVANHVASRWSRQSVPHCLDGTLQEPRNPLEERRRQGDLAVGGCGHQRQWIGGETVRSRPCNNPA